MAVVRVEPVVGETGVSAVAALKQSQDGSSGSFLVLADDDRRFWCKVLNNQQSPRVPVNEQIAGRLGALLGAPVCHVELVYIPAALAGWAFRSGAELVEGWAHGSLAVEPVVETRSLDNRASDDNGRRHAGIVALYDWLGGSDPQWLVRGTEREYFSHDHGHYFPSGPDWTEASLQAARDTPSLLGGSTAGLDAAELGRLADVIAGSSAEDIEECLANIPAGWPVTDAELDALVSYLDYRREPVAARLRAIAGTV